MRRPCAGLLAFALIAALLAGCVPDRMIRLRYAPDSKIERVPSAKAITIFRFADRRGEEGEGNPQRVGGVYDQFGRRIGKVYATASWVEHLADTLVTGFTQRGVEGVTRGDGQFVPGQSAVSTPFALGGEIRNFSTETFWTAQAHVSGIIRLYDNAGTLLFEKPISVRAPRDMDDAQWDKQGTLYEFLMNAAVRAFVRSVVMDADLTARLIGPG